MDTSRERFASFAAMARKRSAQQARVALTIALVIAVLLWQTQWLSLRPGLYILLIGQAAVAAAFFYRKSRLQSLSAESRTEKIAWFGEEERFVQIVATAENSARITGFVVLAYGFWSATHILSITLILGVAYPIISYFGVSRRSLRQTLKRLQMQRRELD